MSADFDVIIIGAGPAGCSCAIKLAQSGKNVLIIDKAAFPRDKICGDALSVDVVNQLEMLSPELALQFKELTTKLPSFGVRMYSPNSHHVDIPFYHKGEKRSGYICSRVDFDDMLFQHLKGYDTIKIAENTNVDNVFADDTGVTVTTSQGNFKAPLVVGADGAHSMVKKSLDPESIDREHHSAGLRVYYNGVSDFHAENYIELYFLKDILPGYLWIFPMTGNRANVGIGMLSSIVSEKNINLRSTLDELLKNHPLFKDRFNYAKAAETVKGHGLPLGSKQRRLSGNRFLLTGDAAGLIDPFTGEGIGNAIRSGRVAAEHALKCFAVNDFSLLFNKAYDEEIYRRMGKELKVSSTLQRLCKYPSLFNFIMNKARKSKYWHQFMINALADVDQKNEVRKPRFYYRLLFK